MEIEIGMMYGFKEPLVLALYDGEINSNNKLIEFRRNSIFMIVRFNGNVVFGHPKEYFAIKILAKNTLGWLFLDRWEFNLLEKFDGPIGV